MTIFKLGEFRLHSGAESFWKIDLDDLGPDDIAALAQIGAKLVGTFGKVVGIERGGIRLAEALRIYGIEGGPLLIVDDVLTTGASMEAMRKKRGFSASSVKGLVVFARGPWPPWVRPIFVYTGGESYR